MDYLIAYDIEDNKNRSKVFEMLKDVSNVKNSHFSRILCNYYKRLQKVIF